LCSPYYFISRDTRPLEGGNESVSHIDAIGELDGKRCLIDWKTTTSRYSEEPEGLLSLDPQLICYSWISNIPDVALVVFVRKQIPEIQCLKATTSEEQRKEFGRLVETTIHELESGAFLLSQRDPIPSERLHVLSSPRPVPQQPPADRNEPHS
jgi:hypothetical protein